MYSNRTIEHLLGPNLATPHTGNAVGLWSATGNNLKILHGGKNPIDNANLQLNGND